MKDILIQFAWGAGGIFVGVVVMIPILARLNGWSVRACYREVAHTLRFWRWL